MIYPAAALTSCLAARPPASPGRAAAPRPLRAPTARASPGTPQSPRWSPTHKVRNESKLPTPDLHVTPLDSDRDC